MNEEKLLAVARYLEGDMEQEEKQGFEAQLQTDTELQQILEEYEDIHQTLKMQLAPDAQDQQMLATLGALNQQYFKKEAVQEKPQGKVVSMKPYLKWISVAAVLIIGLLVWAPWSANLYEQYAISRQMSVAERGIGQEEPLGQAATLFNKKDYAAARKILQRQYMENPNNPLLSYYFSITLIETGQEYEARTVLMKLHEGESAFKYDAAYYVALSFLKEDKKSEAIEWLKKIPEGTANYSKAQELIARLN